MKIRGNLLKMNVLYAYPIQYSVSLGGMEVDVNSLIGKEIKMTYLLQINCIRCGRITSTSFSQGFCFPCFRSAPETEECVLRPELCRAHEGIARDPEYAKSHCLIDHYVYLSFTSGIKVGVTRHHQIPIRWIDQGAIRAMKIAKTPNRFLAGCIEVSLKPHYNDKTNWLRMLRTSVPDIDLRKHFDEAAGLMPEEFRKYQISNSQITEFQYPLVTDNQKLSSLSLEKEPHISGILAGIKGQYLVFQDGRVLNMRKHGGYLVELSF